MKSAKDFWLFICSFMAAGFAYLFGANKLIEKIMKRRFLPLLCILLTYGCAAVTYTDPSGLTVKYVRILTISDKIVGNVGQAAFTVSGQEINVELLKALISAAK